MVLCYRDEYSKILGDQRGDFNVLLAHEWLLSFTKQDQMFKDAANASSQTYKLFSHCTEKTALVNSENEWTEIFKHFGLTLEKVSVGCCGMAGTYGHEKSNLENSKGLFELSWQPKIAELEPEQILATGFSCRSQVKRLADLKAKHPVEALLLTLI
jgi:Fe-S oxidoreductase